MRGWTRKIDDTFKRFLNDLIVVFIYVLIFVQLANWYYTKHGSYYQRFTHWLALQRNRICDAGATVFLVLCWSVVFSLSAPTSDNKKPPRK